MIMNYVLSFCKITAASRIFSRNFYLPLLKPITPKDALRTFKITGKWLLGSKIQHYIPVLYNHKKKRSKRAKNYGKVVHKQNHSYTYMSPVLDPDNENHKLLMKVLEQQKGDDFFVYTVEDKMYNIVFPYAYELAIRNGEIIDILVSQSNDKILIKLKNFKKIAVELVFYEDERVLYKGEGATSEEEEKFHHHGKMIMSLAKIFEAKEKAEEWEMEMMRIVAKKKKQKGEGTKEWEEMVNEGIQNLNWQQFEVDAKKVIDQIWEPAQEEHIGMQVEDLSKTRNIPQFIARHGNAILSQLPTMTEIPEVVKSMATATYHEYEDEVEIYEDGTIYEENQQSNGIVKNGTSVGNIVKNGPSMGSINGDDNSKSKGVIKGDNNNGQSVGTTTGNNAQFAGSIVNNNGQSVGTTADNNAQFAGSIVNNNGESVGITEGSNVGSNAQFANNDGITEGNIVNNKQSVGNSEANSLRNKGQPAGILNINEQSIINNTEGINGNCSDESNGESSTNINKDKLVTEQMHSNKQLSNNPSANGIEENNPSSNGIEANNPSTKGKRTNNPSSNGIEATNLSSNDVNANNPSTNSTEANRVTKLTKRRMSGVKVTLSSGKECFITGQMVKTEDGEVFVPGQTIENDFGETYAPGFTINMDGKPSLVKGLIMSEDGVSKPMFVPTESSITTEGELTFCRNPEEKSKTMPQKIYIQNRTGEEVIEIPAKKKKKKKKVVAKKPAAEEVIMETEEVKTINEDPVVNPVLVVEEPILEVIVCVENPEGEASQEELTSQAASLEERTDSAASFRSDDSTLEFQERKKTDDDIFKPLDDGMEKLIGNLQDKKSELQQKLDDLRKLTITLENAVTYVKTTDANDLANKITSDIDKMHKLSDILLTFTLRANTFREKHAMNIQNITNPSMIFNTTFVTESDERFHACSDKLKVALKSAVYAANDVFINRPKDQLLAMQTLSDILKDTLTDEKALDELIQLLNTKLDRNEICTAILKELTQVVTENKVEVLKSAICLNDKDADNDTIIERISEILEISEGDVLDSAFKKVAKNNEDLTRKVMEHAKLKIDEVKTEMGAKEAVQNCICTAAKEFAEECLLDIENYSDQSEIREVLTEAAGLASTLGLYEIEENLSELSTQNNASVLTGTKSSTEFLKRFMLVRKLCERDYSVKTSLQRIKKHPECGRTDPRIRQLLKDSAVLIAKPRQIKNSLEVPLRLFQEQNFLAIEDCLNQKAQPNAPILISRKGIQAVVPKEAARNVLAGRVPYILVDESGITNFKPMHMFSALKMGKTREKHYEDFSALSSRTSPTSDVRSNRKLSLNDSRMTA